MASGLRLEPSLALKERRLADLLGGRSEQEEALVSVVRDAQLLGSLELAGFSMSWEQVRSAEPPPTVRALRRAQLLTEPQSPLTSSLLLAWHEAVVEDGAGFRRGERSREGLPPAPAEFVPGRIRLLEEWLAMASGQELRPAQAGALALARVVEVLPFEDGNGRVSRLAASQVMVRAGARPPILVKGDRPRLEAALQAAFRLDTEPLSRLLEEAGARSVDVLIQALAGPKP
ncbi:MAG TPA: Fic family protein [Vicinamibacteria bacterium]